jgi:hypothetical protein
MLGIQLTWFLFERFGDYFNHEVGGGQEFCITGIFSATYLFCRFFSFSFHISLSLSLSQTQKLKQSRRKKLLQKLSTVDLQ